MNCVRAYKEGTFLTKTGYFELGLDSEAIARIDWICSICLCYEIEIKMQKLDWL